MSPDEEARERGTKSARRFERENRRAGEERRARTAELLGTTTTELKRRVEKENMGMVNS